MLAKQSNVGATTLRHYEMVGGVPSANLSVLLKLKCTLENAGIEFTGNPLVNPGVTLLIKRDN
jgi:hypothetical protein